MAMCQLRELHLNQVSSAACAGRAHKHSLLNGTSSGVKVMHPDMSGDNAQQPKRAQSIHCHPAHKPTGKIKLDKACCATGSSTEGQPQWSQICQPKLSAYEQSCLYKRGERQEDPVCPSHHQQQKRRLKQGDKKQCCVLRQAASTSKG